MRKFAMLLCSFIITCSLASCKKSDTTAEQEKDKAKDNARPATPKEETPTEPTVLGKAQSDNATKIIGVWELVKSESGGPPRATIEFGKDGKFKMEAKAVKLSLAGTYKVKGNVITLALVMGDKSKDSPGTIKKLTDKELHVADENGKIDEYRRVEGGKGIPTKDSPPRDPEKTGDARGDTGAESLAKLPKTQPALKFKTSARGGSDHPLQLSADGSRLAVNCSTPRSMVQVWELKPEPKMIAEFEGRDFAFSPSGKLLALARDLRCDIVNVGTRKPVATTNEPFTYAFFRDDNTFVSTMRSFNFDQKTKGNILIWNVAKDADAGSFKVADNRFAPALPARNGKEIWLFMNKDRFEVECYDLTSKKLVRTIKPELHDPKKPYRDSGMYQTISADGSTFAAKLAKFHFFDAESGKISGSLPAYIKSGPSGFISRGNLYVASPAGALQVSIARNAAILYDWKAQTAVAVLTGHTSKEDMLAVSSADGKTLVSMARNGETLVFDISDFK